MIHEVILAKLPNHAPPDLVETLMVETRMRLLKVPEILSLSCGKRIDPAANPYPFFIALEFENLAKKRVAYENPIFTIFLAKVFKPNVADFTTLTFEMDPGKDVRFS
ncbi:MAG: hypothetical protein SNJ84_05025 [Verrucomicrobiia bacterium]